MSLTHSEVRRYLMLLGVPESEPSLEALKAIVRAHLVKVPFENVSKLYRWKTSGARELPDCTRFLDGIERNHFGGTCYTNNYHLNQLLTSLGYDAVLCGAEMSKPDVHIVSISRIAGKEYIVDAGYAAPFLEPLPRDLPSDHVISLGTDRYVLSPKDATGHSQLTLYRDGVVQHGYRVNPVPRRIEEFSNVIADSFRPDATFMNAVLLVKFGAGCSTVLHNMTHIECNGTTVRRTSFRTVEDLMAAIQKYFSISPSISQIALDGVSLHQDAWG